MAVRIEGPHQHLQHGGLHGWCEACPYEDRHEALERAVKKDGFATVAHRLNALAVFNKNSNPRLARLARSDEMWLWEKHRGWEEKNE